MPPMRRRTKLTADRAVAQTVELLEDAGCAVNELTRNDYGFDLHVELPEYLPDDTSEEWPMSPYSALVQVKGGAYVDAGVRLDLDRWRFLMGSMAPVYLAAVPQDTDPWIASIEEVAPPRIDWIDAATYSGKPTRRSWSGPGFMWDALLGAKLGSPRFRRWWRLLQPEVRDGPMQDRAEALLRYLLELQILDAISGPALTLERALECVEGVRTMVANHHGLVDALVRMQMANQEDASLGLAVDLSAYVLEGDFVDSAGQVTDDGVAGRNTLVAIGEVVDIRHLALPTIELFLAHLDWSSGWEDEITPHRLWGFY